MLLAIISNFSGIPVLLGFFIKLPILVLLIKLNSMGLLLYYTFINFIFVYFYLNFFKKMQKLNKNNIMVIKISKKQYFIYTHYMYIKISLFAFFFLPIISVIFLSYF